MMKFARYVYWFEALALNLLTGIITFFAPERFVAMFSADTVPSIPLELIRWYGVLLFVFTYVMVRTLMGESNQTLKVLVEGFLLGDVIHLVAIALFLRAGAAITPSVGVMMFTTIALALIRTVWLIQYSQQPRAAFAARKRHA